MTREELIKEVALKMDEISSSDDVIVSVDISDNNPLYTQIDQLLNESINDVLMKAPIYRLDCQIESHLTYKTEDIFGGYRKKVVFEVPSDFIRIASITDECFQRPIVDLSIEGDSIDKLQHNKFLVAKNAKPVAVLGRDIDSKRIISCYSYNSSDNINPHLLYVKRYSDSNLHGETGLDDYLINLVSWVCASKVFSAHGDVNGSKICDDNAASLMI